MRPAAMLRAYVLQGEARDRCVAASSSLRQEMESLRRRHADLRAELDTQSVTIEKLNREKAELMEEMKRMQRLRHARRWHMR